MIYSSACILEYFPSTQGGCKVQKTGGNPMWDDAILLRITKSPVWAMPKCRVVRRLTRKYVGTWFKRILVFLLFWILFAWSKQVQFHNMLHIQSAENVVWFQWFHNCGITIREGTTSVIRFCAATVFLGSYYTVYCTCTLLTLLIQSLLKDGGGRDESRKAVLELSITCVGGSWLGETDKIDRGFSEASNVSIVQVPKFWYLPIHVFHVLFYASNNMFHPHNFEDASRRVSGSIWNNMNFSRYYCALTIILLQYL
jgi:hypothetical protein